jgi:hypothetical protein
MLLRLVGLLMFAACGARQPLPECPVPIVPACDAPASGTTGQGSCAAGSVCVTGFCLPEAPFRWRIADGGFATSPDGGPQFLRVWGTCNGCGVCRFTTGGIAGFAAPEGCVADGPEVSECCDRTSSCTFRH